MKISHLLKKEHIFLDLNPKDKRQLLENFVSALKNKQAFKDADIILESLLKRESLGSTGLERGIAIPHALVEELEEPVIALSVIKNGIDYEAADDLPTYVVMLLLGSKTSPGSQLKILAHICRMVKETNFVEEVKNADSKQDIYDILEKEEGLIG